MPVESQHHLDLHVAGAQRGSLRTEDIVHASEIALQAPRRWLQGVQRTCDLAEARKVCQLYRLIVPSQDGVGAAHTLINGLQMSNLGCDNRFRTLIFGTSRTGFSRTSSSAEKLVQSGDRLQRRANANPRALARRRNDRLDISVKSARTGHLYSQCLEHPQRTEVRPSGVNKSNKQTTYLDPLPHVRHYHLEGKLTNGLV